MIPIMLEVSLEENELFNIQSLVIPLKIKSVRTRLVTQMAFSLCSDMDLFYADTLL